MGTIRIADEVVSIIVGLATLEVEGVAGMSGGFVGGIAEILPENATSTKGVKVAVGETETAIDSVPHRRLRVQLPDVAREVQRNVKKAIENMTV